MPPDQKLEDRGGVVEGGGGGGESGGGGVSNSLRESVSQSLLSSGRASGKKN